MDAYALARHPEAVKVVTRLREKGHEAYFAGGYFRDRFLGRAPNDADVATSAKAEEVQKLKGKITHVHLIDSDGTLNEHNTSTHNPFGTGKLNFDELTPELMKCGVPHDWWCVDLCFWPNAWDVTAQSKKYLDGLRAKYAAA